MKAGDVCAAPAGGPETAHQLINTGTHDAEISRHLRRPSATPRWSNIPNSGKFAVTSRYDWATGKGGIRYVGRKDSGVDYWDGE